MEKIIGKVVFILLILSSCANEEKTIVTEPQLQLLSLQIRADKNCEQLIEDAHGLISEIQQFRFGFLIYVITKNGLLT